MRPVSNASTATAAWQIVVSAPCWFWVVQQTAQSAPGWCGQRSYDCHESAPQSSWLRSTQCRPATYNIQPNVTLWHTTFNSMSPCDIRQSTQCHPVTYNIQPNVTLRHKTFNQSYLATFTYTQTYSDSNAGLRDNLWQIWFVQHRQTDSDRLVMTISLV